MASKSQKSLTRRDTIKVLAAAVGAGALANIPGKWVKPGMDFGTLPAHAQSSVPLHTLLAGQDAIIQTNVEQAPITVNSTAAITPPTPGIVLRYSVTLGGDIGGSEAIVSPNPPTGTLPTNASGTVSLPVTYSNVWFGVTITVDWRFENSSDGIVTDQQVFSTPQIPG